MGQSVAFSVQQARREGGMVLPGAGWKGDYFKVSEWQTHGLMSVILRKDFAISSSVQL